jgi:3-oxoacyl-[acyl-carrier-protein] synthase II
VLFHLTQQNGPRQRGVVTALGPGWKANSDGIRSGRVAFRPVTHFDSSRQRAKTAAEVDLSDTPPPSGLPAASRRRMDRATRMLLRAADEAWKQSGWQPAENLPMVLGTTSGGMALGEAYYRHAIRHPNSSRGQPSRVLYYQAQRQAMDVAETFGFQGPITIIANACASGANAIGHAWSVVRSGQAPRVLAGGYDAISHMVFSGFDSLQALSTTQCRPFDAGRDGLGLGEGAAIIALESLEHARQRGAVILAELAGYGATTDCHHLTQPHPGGNAAFDSMRQACEAAGVTAGEINYVNAHGTGTPLNDSAEAAAINRWAGQCAKALPVSSTKASIGHLLGAAGAVEAVITVMSVREQWIPPTSTLETPDPVCQFRLPKKAEDGTVNFALSNSFGFGGANATLIFRRWE